MPEELRLPPHIENISGCFFNRLNNRWVGAYKIEKICNDYWAQQENIYSPTIVNPNGTVGFKTNVPQKPKAERKLKFKKSSEIEAEEPIIIMSSPISVEDQKSSADIFVETAETLESDLINDPLFQPIKEKWDDPARLRQIDNRLKKENADLAGKIKKRGRVAGKDYTKKPQDIDPILEEVAVNQDEIEQTNPQENDIEPVEPHDIDIPIPMHGNLPEAHLIVPHDITDKELGKISRIVKSLIDDPEPEKMEDEKLTGIKADENVAKPLDNKSFYETSKPISQSN